MTRILDVNLNVTDGGETTCSHCDRVVGTPDGGYLDVARWHEQPSTAAGQDLVRADPFLFADRAIVLRQAFCPGCLTLLLTEIVPEDEPSLRRKRLGSSA